MPCFWLDVHYLRFYFDVAQEKTFGFVDEISLKVILATFKIGKR